MLLRKLGLRLQYLLIKAYPLEPHPSDSMDFLGFLPWSKVMQSRSVGVLGDSIRDAVSIGVVAYCLGELGVVGPSVVEHWQRLNRVNLKWVKRGDTLLRLVRN